MFYIHICQLCCAIYCPLPVKRVTRKTFKKKKQLTVNWCEIWHAFYLICHIVSRNEGLSGDMRRISLLRHGMSNEVTSIYCMASSQLAI